MLFNDLYSQRFKIQMNQPSLSNSDIAHLYDILEQANKNYIKQSRSKEKPAFNILRVLSALRLLFPQSPSTLYNTIIFITKNYDPQTHYHWKKAIEDLNANRGLFRSKSNYCRPEINMHTRTYQNSFNRSRINDSHENLQSKSYAQIHIPQQNTSNHQSFFNQDQKEQSQTNAQTGKRMFYTKADSLSHISKNHYISFEPYRNKQSFHQDKENINSTNVQESRKKQSSYQYIEAIQRDLIRTAKQSQNKTPIDQSFIKKINSYESPYLYSRQQPEHDPIEEQMNIRAKTFYRFNLQLKVFSSLQANSFVYQKAKENQMKAKLKHRSQLFHKTFRALVNNIEIQKDIRYKDEKADSFFKAKTSSKIFNIIRLMYDLHKNEQNPMVIQKMKKINYEFILTLLFALHNEKQEQMVGFNERIMELIHSDQSNKLYLIVKYFGKHSWITQKNIEHLINQYKLSICKQVMTVLIKEKQINCKFDTVRQTNLKKQSFYALKLRWNLFACYKQKIKIAQAKRNKILLHKIMKSLLKNVFSTKLYSKRCEYIERKHMLCIKTNTFAEWIQKARMRMQDRKDLNKKCQILIEKIQRYITRVSFNSIKLKIKELDQKIAKVTLNIKIQQKNNFFNRLKAILYNKQQINKVHKSIQSLICKTSIARWKESTKKGKAISTIILYTKINCFRQLILPQFQYAINKVREMHSNQQNMIRSVFLSLKKFTLQEQQRRQNLQQRTKIKLTELTKISAIKAIKLFNTAQKKEKQMQVLSRKIQKYEKLKIFLNQHRFISKLTTYSLQHFCFRDNQQKLTKSLKNMSQQYFYTRLQNHQSLMRNSDKVSLMALRNRHNQISNILRNVVQLSKIQKIKHIRKKNSSYQLTKIIQNECKKQCNNKKKAAAFYNKSLKVKTIESLTAIIKQSKQVKKIAKKFQRRNCLKTIKISLSQFRKQCYAQKIHKKYSKKKVFESLIAERSLKMSKNQLSCFINTHLKNQLIISLKENRKKTQQSYSLNLKTIQCLKIRVMSKLQSFYIQNLISKKYLYMAIKFRALKLSLNAFSALISQKQPKRPILMCHKLLAERLSTDLV